MYNHKLAICLLVDGKVLREQGETVRLPFGTEYAIRVKNLNSVRALVKIEIDGQDIADGQGFIVPAHGEIDIERFLKGRNMEAGNRFKFIERNSKVEAGRGGIQVEDGLIRIEHEFEREAVPVRDYYHTWYGDPWPYHKPPYIGSGVYYSATTQLISSSNSTPFTATSSTLNASAPRWADNIEKSAEVPDVFASAELSAKSTRSRQPYTKTMGSTQSASAQADASVYMMNAINDAGITAPGSVSQQKFNYGYIGALDGVKHVSVLKLLGQVGEQLVTKPHTVKSKQKCVTCGHNNKSHAKFCVECGTGLQIVV